MQDETKPALEAWETPTVEILDLSETEGGIAALQEADGGVGFFS